ncbi:MAG TPA: hypothetical protein VEO00_08705 [Actinomycetota bacterium]|nr:hypothetical protein [Actinomycetota bacterium]
MKARPLVVVGIVLQAAVGALVLVSGLIMPIWAVIALGVVWAIGTGLAIRWRRRPSLVLLVPLVVLAIWALAAWAGEAFLDWTA